MHEILELIVAAFLYVIVTITDALFNTDPSRRRKH
jgi:hypothetical protein